MKIISLTEYKINQQKTIARILLKAIAQQEQKRVITGR